MPSEPIIDILLHGKVQTFDERPVEMKIFIPGCKGFIQQQSGVFSAENALL